MSDIGELVQGCIDLHVHMSPEPRVERRFDAIQLAVAAREAGMAGLVMKSHYYPSAPLVYAVSQTVKDIALFGSIALNKSVGGLNPDAVEVSGRLGARVVWLPTVSAKSDRLHSGPSGKGISVFDESGHLVPELYDILDVVRQFDMALATGHLSQAESFAVIDAAREKGVKKIIYTHPLLGVVGPPLTIDDQKEVARRGAFLEYCTYSLMPTGERMAPEVMAEAIRKVGPAHCFLSSDFGQAVNPSPPEGMRVIISAMLNCGIGKADLELMVKTNPSRLLGLS